MTRAEEYLKALTIFVEIYGTAEAPPIQSQKDASGLSFFGLCLALVRKQYKNAVDLCKRAIDLEFYNGDHYANLAKVYLAAGQRKKAVETADQGLKLAPENEDIIEVRKELGVRSRPAVPLLDRGHPINVTIGQARHARKESGRGSKKK
ncbi:MAG TPA: tetratricopeptide repeat protein [Thermoanaerobaculia bacterium]